MKTILVVYTDVKNREAYRKKRYAFNTNSDVIVGDFIDSNDYDTNMLVVRVLDNTYKYYNGSTGELSDNFNSTQQWEIRQLVVADEVNDNIVYATFADKEPRSMLKSEVSKNTILTEDETKEEDDLPF